MQTFKRESIHAHCVGAEWPTFLGGVELGESFRVETEAFNLANGPLGVAGIRAGDVIAIHIEAIDIAPPFSAPNGGPFFEGMGPPVELEYRDGWFCWPGHFRLRARPSVGNMAVLPARGEAIREMARYRVIDGKRIANDWGWRRVVNDPRGKHCHQDCWALAAGSAIHMRAQVDGAGLCLADVHGHIGQGELAFAGIEVAACVQVRVERSTDWRVDWPIIETADEILVCVSCSAADPERSGWRYVDLVREGYRALREVVAARIGGTIEEANSIVATAADLRNCALYGLGEGYIPQDKGKPPYDLSVVACLEKEILV